MSGFKRWGRGMLGGVVLAGVGGAGPVRARDAAPGIAAPGTAVTGTAMTEPATAAGASGPVVALLLQQARYWREHSGSAQAQGALARALQVAPRDPDVLELQGEMQLDRGDTGAARATRAELERVAPGAVQGGRLDAALRERSVDPAALDGVRAAAGRGDDEAAATGYRALFGPEPPPGVALEYYQTLAGTAGGWSAARAGLARLVSGDRDDLQKQLAYARVLTYREDTRLDGIARLRRLAGVADEGVAAAARSDWRQALLWLPNVPASVTPFQDWLRDHPSDAVLAERARRAAAAGLPDAAGAGRRDGFGALAGGRLDEAGSRFSTVLAGAPEDADALGGLGLVRARQGRAEEAAALLRRAIAADPAHAARWQPALDGLSVGADYAAARDLIARGRLDEAEARLRVLERGPGDPSGARLMLAAVLERRGRDEDAAGMFDGVLRAHPDDPDALLGLARLDARRGRTDAARALLDRLGGRRGAEAAQVEAAIATGAADRAGDEDDRIAALREAVDRNGLDPWLRLRLAQALRRRNRADEAREVMAPVAAGARPGAAALQAAILFAAADDDMAAARALLARLPARNRTPEVEAAAGRVRLDAEIDAAAGSGGRYRLLDLARQPDPDGERGVRIARALDRLGDRAGAARAMTLARNATPEPTAMQLLNYAGAALGLSDAAEVREMLAALDRSGAILAPDQQDARRRIADGLAVREADALNERGRRADAFDRLAPALHDDPAAAAPNLALARLFQADARPSKALALDLAVLERDPADMDARLAAVRAAVDARDMERAGELARDGIVIDPQDPRAWLAAAAVHEARGDAPNTLADLRKARDLRQQQLGGGAGGDGTSSSAASSAIAAPADDNPFRRDAAADRASDGTAPEEDGADGSAVVAGHANDPMLASIDGRLAALRAQTDPRLDADAQFRSRSGSGGLDSLAALSVPVTATFPVGTGGTRWLATVTPVTLASGTLDPDTGAVRRFGAGALGAVAAPGNPGGQAGLGLSVGFAGRWLAADIGTSPLGFRTTSILGGAELSPKLGDGVTLRLTGERRAVTDSVLSYAGERDPGTGAVWGGVTRTRGHAQVEIADQTAVFYVGGGFAAADGQRVAANTEGEAGVGGSVQVWRDHDQSVRVGLDVDWFGYARNLRYFTLGQGGYFSPQSYAAATVPVTWTGKAGPWSWTLGGSLGYQTYDEHRSDYFPDDPTLQAALERTGGVSSFDGDVRSGLAAGANGRIDYAVTPALHLGAAASFQRAGNWDEAQATVSARYAFSEGQR